MSTSTSVTVSRIAAIQAPALPSVRLRAFAWGVTGYNVLVILWGSIVRSTGSGAGCGEHWPLCGGAVVQHWQTLASVIEFAHRATSGVALILLVALLGWTWRATAPFHLARVAAVASAVLTFNEALIGALLVLLGLTANNRSPLRAVYLSLHLANTLLLLAVLGLTAHFLSRDAGRMRGSVEYRDLPRVLAGLALTLGVGVTGSLAALGDTLYPAHSLREALAQDWAAHSPWLIRLRWVHPAASLLAAAFVAWILMVALRSPAHRRAGQWLAVLLGLQMALGVADVLLLAPVWLQVAHLLGADLLWLSLIVLCARLVVAPIGCPGGGCSFNQQPSSSS